ncbi:hypothetical protein [Chryseobacterium sp. HSC-36S06]|uniref:hypothetical protein n=1 Tax=Chryseobacterium sp. HSC-36S06 TaxID=2910970 RepID=UPI00209FDEEA|nr:hypothetical protein [Chryseobacterium sp. HSC-36S06]MCP2038565.1 hypothetical protein [Chryseobacterium sp. HSC-36S06]
MENNKMKQSEKSHEERRSLENDENQDIEMQNSATTRLKDVRNPEITQENFVKDAENAIPPLAWKNQKKAYDDAWENNKNQQLGEEV